MTQRQFLEELDRVQDRFEWQLSADVNSKAEQRSRPRLVLHAKPKTEPSTRALDPVAAVCYAHTAQVHGLKSAAEALGMAFSDAAALVAASKDNTYAGPDGQRKPVDALVALRGQLLAIVGEVVARRSATGS
jgi:hypothetical protein